jgi:hypothetical protein
LQEHHIFEGKGNKTKVVEKVLIIVIVIAALYFIVRRLLHAIAKEPGINPCEGCSGCSSASGSVEDGCSTTCGHGAETAGSAEKR